MKMPKNGNVLLALLFIASLFVYTAISFADTGGYPYADYFGPNSNPAECRWTDSSGNPGSPYGYYYRNCTDFVAWKLSSANSFSLPPAIGNAAQWGVHYSPITNSVPAVGAVAWWPAYSLDNGYSVGSYGHVAWTRSVNTDGSVTIEEYNRIVNGVPDGAYHTRTIKQSSTQQVMFIHLKDMGGASIVADGTCVKTSGNATVYLVAGGTPIPIPAWSYIGGAKPVITITQSQLESMPAYPKDGVYIKEYDKATVYVTAGGAAIPIPAWSTVGGAKPVTVVPKNSVSGNSFLDYPQDSTCVKEYGKNTVYIVAGGAPIPIPGWSSIGGSKPVVVIPKNSVSGNSFLDYPQDSTYVKEYGNNTVYVVAGGAPIPIPGWSSIGGSKPVVVVPSGSIATSFLQYPQDGTAIVEYGNATVYIVAGGMGFTVTSFSAIGGPVPVTILPVGAVSDYLLQLPVDGTLVEGYATGKVYEIVSGIASPVAEWGQRIVTIVDQWAIENELHVTE